VQGGFQAEVSQRIEETARQFDGLITLITGGDAGWLSLSPQKKIFAEPDLLLFGLFQIDTHHAI
jgi:hypothetical protein